MRKNDGEYERISLYLHSDIVHKLKLLAVKENRNVSNMATHLLDGILRRRCLKKGE